MNLKFEKIGIALLTAMIVLALTGCPTTTDSFSSNATVVGVKIAGVQALTLGTPSEEWTQAIENCGHVFVPNQSLTAAKVEVSTTDSGASVFLAQATLNVLPDFVRANVFDFEGEDFLYVEVFSANLDAYLIYAIQVHNRNPGIADLTLGGRSAMGGKTLAGTTIPAFGKIGKPAASWDAIEEEGEIAFGDSQEGSSLEITVRPEVASSSIRIAAASSGTPNFSGAFLNANEEGVVTGLRATAVDGGYIYVEVKGDNTFGGMTYYKLKMVSKKSDLGLKSAKFVYYDGETKLGEFNLAIGPMGTHSWSGGENYGNYDNGAEVSGAAGSSQQVNVSGPGIFSKYLDAEGRPPAGFRIALEIEGNDPELKKAFAVNKNQRATPEFNNTTGDFGNLLGFWWWGVEVTSGIGEKAWYKFASRIGSQNINLGSVKINGVSLDISQLQGNTTAADTANGFITYTLPAGENFSSVKVEAAPPDGYQSLIGVVMSPSEFTNIAPISFDINYDASYDSATHVNTTTLSLEPGQFVVIRVLAEISWYYGGSGFVGATWQPAVQPAGGSPGYTAWKYYKIQIVRGATDTGLTGIKYKGVDITLPNPSTLNVATNTSYSQDSKKNIITSTTTTLNWYQGTALEYETQDYSNVLIEVTPAYPNLQIGYAVAANNNPLNDTDFKSSGQLEFVESNNWIVIRVASEDGTNVLYYRIHVVSPLGSAYAPTQVTVNGIAASEVGDGYAAFPNTQITSIPTVSLPDKESFGKINIAVAVPNTGIEVAYANGFTTDDSGGVVVDWNNTSGEFVDAAVAQYVYIRTRSADRTQTRFYKYRLILSGARNEMELTALSIKGVSVTPPAANTAVTGTTSVLYRVPGDSETVLYGLKVEATASQGASIAYAMVAANNENTTDFSNTDGEFPTWQNAYYLVIRVSAEDGMNIRYYKVRIAWGRDGATLTDITINGASITGETSLPAPNSAATGTTAVVYHVAQAALADIRVVVSADPGASVAYAMAAANNTDTTDWSNLSGRFTPFTATQYLVIRVASEDRVTVNYYKVRVAVGSGSTTITGITINGQSIGTLPNANTAVTGTTAESYTSSTMLSPVTVAATQATGNGAAITYATAAAANTNVAAGNFTATNSFALNSGQYAVIRVVSQDTLNTVYYKVQVFHGNPAAELLGITINNDYVIPVPTANTAVTGTAAGTLQVNDLNLTVKVGVSPGASVAFASAAAANSNTTNWTNTTGVFPSFTDGNYVVVRVISQNGQVTRYYKVQVTL